jgi:hypothetical protein
MSEKTHFTPKPWQLTYELQDDIDADGNGYAWAIQVMRTDGSYAQNPGYATSEGYAKLFSAAPELLKALQDVLYYRTGIPDLDSSYVTNCALAKAHAAIAKATNPERTGK